MKHIDKGSEPEALRSWKEQWTRPEVLKWDDLPPDVGKVMKHGLFDEQGHLCCYCGRRIIEHDSHIEHLVPRSPKTGDPNLTFAWNNLLASCQKNLVRGDPRHCGTSKGDWYDVHLMVSPLDESCERRFRYELDGRVKEAVSTDTSARETMARLQLDCAHLRALRKKAIESLFEIELNREDCEKLRQAYQCRNALGQFEPFCFVILAALDALLE